MTDQVATPLVASKSRSRLVAWLSASFAPFGRPALHTSLLLLFIPTLGLLVGNALLAASLVEGTARPWILATGMASVVLMVILVWIIQRCFVLPLRSAVETARRILSGDLTQALASGTRTDELGQLSTALDELRNCLFKVVRDVRIGTTTVSSTSSQINRDNTLLSERTSTQATSLQQTAASMEQITTTVRENADRAEQAELLVNGASGYATKGGEVVGQVVTTMKSIKESSQRIADIIGVIDGIAFQTNILALNAAVEAARAGEGGRGFAVVAAEVRTLAQGVAAAAKEIKQLINDSVERVDAGNRLVDASGAAMEQILSSIQLVAQIMKEMASASSEQSVGIQRVNEAISAVDEMVQQNAKLVQDARQTAVTLNEQAVSLLRSVETYDLGTREHGNADEAQTLVRAGVAFFREHGKQALLDEINKLGKGRFIDRDLYLMAVGIADQTFYAHGNNPRVLGLGQTSKDVDGKFFVKEIAGLAKTGGQGWVDYKWAHPVTNEIQMKSSYVEAAGDLAVACGVYKN